MFFVKSEDSETSGITALQKSDRLALESIVEVLRLQEENSSAEELVHRHTLDLRPPRGKSGKTHKKKGEHAKDNIENRLKSQ